MGLPELVARLERDADARVAAIEDRCRCEVEALEAEAARAVSRRAADELAVKHAERRARLDRELSAARRRARQAVLSAERSLVDRVLARASALLDEAERDEAYRSSLGARVSNALRFVHGRATVRCRPELAPSVREALGANALVNVEEDMSVGAGFVVTSADGAMDIDDTLAARLARARDALAIEILREISDAR